MARLLKPILLSSLLLAFQNAHASTQPTTFLGPSLRASYTDVYNEVGAASILGEAGVRSYRIGGTLGFQFWHFHRVKLSVEYLTQNIAYHFFAGDTTQWLSQGAIGGTYQYHLIGLIADPVFELNAYYSHGPNKTLDTRFGSFTQSGVPIFYFDQRRIAGSHDGSASPGVRLTMWRGGRVGLDLNYDNINYNKKSPPTQNQRGFGGTISIKQIVTDVINFGVLVGIRNPFNDYQANLNFANLDFYGRWTVGVMGEYLAGKNTLPNTYNAGLTANYSLDQRCRSLETERNAAKRFIDYKQQAPVKLTHDDFAAWTTDPAVHLPQVLAVPDENLLEL